VYATYFRVKVFKAVEAFLFSLKAYKFIPTVRKHIFFSAHSSQQPMEPSPK
jgi:hypothetical protein